MVIPRSNRKDPADLPKSLEVEVVEAGEAPGVVESGGEGLCVVLAERVGDVLRHVIDDGFELRSAFVGLLDERGADFAGPVLISNL